MSARRRQACLSVPQLTREALRLGSTVARLKLKGIDGGPHKRWSMWFNSTQRAEPYQLLTCPVGGREIGSVSSAGRDTGGGWLFSARFVTWWVKSRNERNPHLQLPSGEPGTLQKLPVPSRRKAGMTSSPHGPYGLGYTRATMAVTEGGRGATPRQSQKTVSVRIALCNSRA